MTRLHKLVGRFQSRPRDFTWAELRRLPEGVGYIEVKTGRTSGSRVRFVHPNAPTIYVHRPHPGKIVKMYLIDDIARLLTEAKLI
ncbi:MAG: type II toxin-antitoxin system HicA family toxin [Gammaproteobacteria bacterium]|nr:type II toxin-antitoxin system HicA family toxin [Gammaproteobacteria bacterium]